MGGRAKGKSITNSHSHLPPHSKIPNTLATCKRTYDRAFSKETLGHGTLTDGDSNITESVSFLDAVLTNRVLLQTLTAQDILKCKFVCKSWKSAINDNINFIRIARGDNRSCDWYFPLFNMSQHEEHVGSLETLHGMWHHHSSTSELHKLPPLAYLPRPTAPNACICKAFRKDIVYFVRVSLGGLLLVETVNALWTRRCSRYPIIRHNRNGCFYHNNWPILMVTNPLTNLFEVLPIHGEEGKPNFEGYGPDFHMIVDEIANTYKVLVLRSGPRIRAPPRLHIYDSGSKIWERVSPTQLPLQPSLGCWMDPLDLALCKIYASICARGRLYLADLRAPTAIETGMDDQVRAVVRLFQINIETQEQILCTQIPLRKEFNLAVEIEAIEFPTDICRNLGLVECMGRLYAVIPARLDEEVYQPNRVRQNVWENAATMGSTYMALQFYIFQLEGDVGIEGHGVLRIQLPITRKNCKNIGRRQSLLVKLWNSGGPFGREIRTPSQNWFSCTSKGSIIWVTVEDYLLQYDVLTGKSTTEILPPHLDMKHKVGMAYQASFHMKP